MIFSLAMRSDSRSRDGSSAEDDLGMSGHYRYRIFPRRGDRGAAKLRRRSTAKLSKMRRNIDVISFFLFGELNDATNLVEGVTLASRGRMTAGLP